MSENPQPRKPADWVQSPSGVTEIYANQAHITWTLDDVRVRLGQMVTSQETLNPGPGYAGAIEERAAVTFSWRNAKLLREGLTALIAEYERVNGEINLAPTLVSPPDL